jgi:hypothetical protein
LPGSAISFFCLVETGLGLSIILVDITFEHTREKSAEDAKTRAEMPKRGGTFLYICRGRPGFALCLKTARNEVGLL